MIAAALPLRPAAAARTVPQTAFCLAGICLFGALLRLPMLGDPAYKIDEQFYLLVGNRMLDGAIPYVDIWDRKPIGLFLIYAAAGLAGNGIVAYQLLATACAIGTALCIFAIARPRAGDVPAAIAGILYLLWLEVAEGGGGQAPVFYGLPMAGAAAMLLGGSDGARRGRAAMLLVGVAIQIKYTAVFEGAFFGLVAALQAWRRSGMRALGEIAVLALIAASPTLLAIGFYAAIGHLREFWFANFTSIFLRGPTAPADLAYRTQMALLRLVPLATCVAASLWELRHDRAARGWQAFMLGWCGCAVAAFFALGVLYSHYLLPVFLPFAAAAAPIFRRRPLGLVLAGLCAWLPASNLHWPDFAATRRSERQMAALAALVPSGVDHGCLQMFDGPPILYQLTRACTPGRFVFPDHLSAAIEARAIGVDPVMELRRVLARRPLAITIGDVDVRPPNAATFAVMRDALARDYRLAGRSWVDERYILVFVRRD